jgi:hypothetical protein
MWFVHSNDRSLGLHFLFVVERGNVSCRFVMALRFLMKEPRLRAYFAISSAICHPIGMRFVHSVLFIRSPTFISGSLNALDFINLPVPNAIRSSWTEITGYLHQFCADQDMRYRSMITEIRSTNAITTRRNPRTLILKKTRDFSCISRFSPPFLMLLGSGLYILKAAY